MANPILLGVGTTAKNKPLVGTATDILPLWDDSGSGTWTAVAVTGDVSLTSAGLFTVTAVQGVAWTTTPPAVGQVPTYNGSTIEWASPAGGGGSSGGGGLTYLLNYSVSGESPVPSGTWEQLSLTPTTSSAVNTGAVTAPNGSWANLADFVTDLGEPGATTIPPGFWDLNVYLSGSGSANETEFRIVVGKWDGTTQTDLYTSASVPITDPTNPTPVLYTASLFVPSTALSATERITIRVQVQRTVSNAHTVTGYFEGIYYSHLHTQLGGPGGTGLVKVVNGIVQAPASLLYAADISGSTGGLDGAGKLFIGRTGGNGPAVATLTGGTGITVTNGDGTISLAVDSSVFLTVASAASTYYPQTNPAGYITSSALSGYLLASTAASTYLALAGGTMTGKLTTVAAATGGAGFNLPAGTAPTSPTNGDLWTTTAGLFARINGTTQQYAPLASPSFTGTPTAPTAAAGTNTTQVSTTAFVTTAVAAAVGAPYDLPVEVPGTPATSTRIVNFKAVRPFRLASSGHQGGCAVTDPSSNTSFTVKKNGSSTGVGGTITFNSNGTFSSSVTQTDFAIGDLLTVETQSALNGMDTPFFTLAMTLL